MQVAGEGLRGLDDRAEAESDGTAGQRRGFTLLELVVSIGVLIILTGMMLPALHSAVRNSAGKVKCSTNLLQLGLALKSYANEHSDQLPESGYFPFRGVSPHRPLAQVLMPYFKSIPRNDVTKMWVCPNDDEISGMKKPDRSSYVYPPGRCTDNSYRLKLDVLPGQFPLLGDSEPFHATGYSLDLSSGPSMPKIKLERNEWSDDFEFPDGHNRYRVDGAVTTSSLSKSVKSEDK